MNWDRSNGRIYRIAATNAPANEKIDLERLSSLELVGLLKHPNRWFANRARVILRRSPRPKHCASTRSSGGSEDLLSLQGLWALNATTDLSDDVALKLLAHPEADVRSSTMRLLGDGKEVSRNLAATLLELARSEEERTVRQQLAASAASAGRERLTDCLCTALLRRSG